MTSLHNIRGKDAARAFADAGGKVRTGNGDHVNLKMPNGQLITIPVSGTIKIGLLKIGLTEEEFERLLGVNVWNTRY